MPEERALSRGDRRFQHAFRRPRRRAFDEAWAFEIVRGPAIPLHGASGATGLFRVAAAVRCSGTRPSPAERLPFPGSFLRPGAVSCSAMAPTAFRAPSEFQRPGADYSDSFAADAGQPGLFDSRAVAEPVAHQPLTETGSQAARWLEVASSRWT